MDLPESHPLIRAKRRAGRIKRYLKRKWWERNIGKQYKAWLAGIPAATGRDRSTTRHPSR